MANTVKVKMKCTGLDLGVQGRPDVVVLEQIYDTDTTKHNVEKDLGPRSAVAKGRLQLEIAAGTVGAGQFKKDQNYAVSFLEVT